ncbi:MAG TPA: hypothetical protein VJT14_06725, partial [Candidatus Dormibacteraeota bacterium]|nr:hypothetical protein [Candidatus Dormibacteraeota bacterium]
APPTPRLRAASGDTERRRRRQRRGGTGGRSITDGEWSGPAQEVSAPPRATAGLCRTGQRDRDERKPGRTKGRWQRAVARLEPRARA